MCHVNDNQDVKENQRELLGHSVGKEVNWSGRGTVTL